ncbi:MAG TPA: ornithine carbamoyltransferase [Mycobacteriales bacterium]|nr:ornithine carbamoyltransferase [Mycobacteriales bacterium]
MPTPRHFLADDDLTPDELEVVLDDAARRKVNRHGTGSDLALAGKAVALIFEKPSTRTRVSFEVGVTELGGHPVVIDASTTQLGRGETLEDTAMVLSRYCGAIVIRTFGQDRIERIAAAASVPVVNALTDFAHPCQAIADLQTIRERRGELAGLTLTYVGDGNNVAHSLMLAGAAAGMRVRVATPPGYEPVDGVVERARDIATATGGAVMVMSDALEAATGADVLYTDVWASMGQESEARSRLSLFQGYQLDDRLVSAAHDDVVVLHCLPAHRGEEIAADVIDGPHSAVWDQAENRLHAQKALLAFLVERSG